MTELLGWLTVTALSLCYIPQLLKTLREKRVENISLWQWILQFIGFITGMLYAGCLKQLPLFVGYAWGFGCTGLFLFLYWKYHKKKNSHV